MEVFCRKSLLCCADPLSLRGSRGAGRKKDGSPGTDKKDGSPGTDKTKFKLLTHDD
jgi:hypothetical protein